MLILLTLFRSTGVASVYLFTFEIVRGLIPILTTTINKVGERAHTSPKTESGNLAAEYCQGEFCLGAYLGRVMLVGTT